MQEQLSAHLDALSSTSPMHRFQNLVALEGAVAEAECTLSCFEAKQQAKAVVAASGLKATSSVPIAVASSKFVDNKKNASKGKKGKK